MIPTLPLSSIWEAWRDVLNNNSQIQNYCQIKYGKPYRLYVGMDIRKKPTLEDCPFIVMHPGIKTEGVNQPENSYTIPIGWAICNDNKVITGNLIEYTGLKECDEIGQMIIGILGELSPNNPISTLNYEINGIDHFPQIVGEMYLQIDMQVLMGVIPQY